MPESALALGFLCTSAGLFLDGWALLAALSTCKGAREAPGCLDKVRTVRQKVLEATAYVTAAAEQGRLLLHLAVL